MKQPWTRDGEVGADMVSVTPDVSGLIRDVIVQQQIIHSGEFGFRINPDRFRRFVQRAEATVVDRHNESDKVKLVVGRRASAAVRDAGHPTLTSSREDILEVPLS